MADSKIAYRTVNVDGVDIFYREAGPKDARTVLLFHGFPSSSQMFRGLIPLLMDKYHIVAPDFPGYGQSSAPPLDRFEYTFEKFVDVMDHFTAKIDLKSARAQTLESLQGKKDDKLKKEGAATVKQSEKTLEQARAVGGVTFAVAASRAVNARLSQESHGGAADHDALVIADGEHVARQHHVAAVGEAQRQVDTRADRWRRGGAQQHAALLHGGSGAVRVVPGRAAQRW